MRRPVGTGGKGDDMLNSFFKLDQHGTTVRTEILAGITTFLTMAYIIFVNPSILAAAGMDQGAVFVATCLSAAIGSAITRVCPWSIAARTLRNSLRTTASSWSRRCAASTTG